MEDIMEVFKFDNDNIRIGNLNDMIWFAGRDIAKILGYSDLNQAIRKNVDDEDKTTISMNTKGGKQNIVFINESGMYSLIFSASKQSKNENVRNKARKFKRWVTSEVLPTIRQTGGYITDNKVDELKNGGNVNEFIDQVNSYKNKIREMNDRLVASEINTKRQRLVIDLYSNMLDLYSMEDMVEEINKELDTTVIDIDIIKNSLAHTGYIILKDNGKYNLSEMTKEGNFSEVKEIISINGVSKKAYFNEAVKNHIKSFIGDIMEESNENPNNDKKFINLFYDEIYRNVI